LLFDIGIAQDSIEKVTLTPYIEWLTKKTYEKRSSRIVNIDDFGGNIKPTKIRADFEIEPKTLAKGENTVIITVRTTIRELVFQEVGSTPQAKLNYFIRIVSKDRTIDGVIEEVSSISIELEKLVNGNTNDLPVIYRRIVSLPKGKYVADFLIRDVESGNNAKKKMKFDIK
jgi:hypothetical protein